MKEFIQGVFIIGYATSFFYIIQNIDGVVKYHRDNTGIIIAVAIVLISLWGLLSNYLFEWLDKKEK